MFARRHYEFIASVMKDSRPAKSWDSNKKSQWESTLSSMVEKFALDNPRFKAPEFIAACGGNFWG